MVWPLPGQTAAAVSASYRAVAQANDAVLLPRATPGRRPGARLRPGPDRGRRLPPRAPRHRLAALAVECTLFAQDRPALAKGGRGGLAIDASSAAISWSRRPAVPRGSPATREATGDVPLLMNIAVALAAALVGGLLARRPDLPPLAGYLLAGVAIGPSPPASWATARRSRSWPSWASSSSCSAWACTSRCATCGRARRRDPGALAPDGDHHCRRLRLGRLLGLVASRPASCSGLAISIASTVVLSARPHGQGPARQPPRRSRRRLAGARGPGDGADPGGPARAASGRRRRLAAASASPSSRPRVFVGLMLFVGARLVPWLLLRDRPHASRASCSCSSFWPCLGTALAAADVVRRVARARAPSWRGRGRRVAAQPPGRRRRACPSARPSRYSSSCRWACWSTRLSGGQRGRGRALTA